MLRDKLDDSLFGKSYVYSEIGKTKATVIEDGLVVAIAPSYFQEALRELLKNGFSAVSLDQPPIGFHPISSAIMSEEVSYYAKECKQGEELEFFSSWVLLFGREVDESDYYVHSWISTPANLITGDGLNGFTPDSRLWHGIPSIDRTKSGRLYLGYGSGNECEPRLDNYVVYSYSEDGENWKEFCVAVHPSIKDSRVFDASVWVDPKNRLWMFWSQSCEREDGYMGVWYVRVDDPDAPISEIEATLKSAEPTRLCNGIKLNKPTVLSNGEWMFGAVNPACAELDYVVSSTDEGESWSVKSTPTVIGCQHADEPMILELEKNELALFVRSTDGTGIRVAYSHDNGNTFDKCQASGLDGPCSRFHIKRLKSGRVLLINHYGFTGRSHLTAMLSEDNGKTFPYKMLLDGRRGVSYPDATEREGVIYVTWDYDRNGEGEILFATFTEQDVINGGEIDKQKVRVVIKNTK